MQAGALRHRRARQSQVEAGGADGERRHATATVGGDRSGSRLPACSRGGPTSPRAMARPRRRRRARERRSPRSSSSAAPWTRSSTPSGRFTPPPSIDASTVPGCERHVRVTRALPWAPTWRPRSPPPALALLLLALALPRWLRGARCYSTASEATAAARRARFDKQSANREAAQAGKELNTHGLRAAPAISATEPYSIRFSDFSMRRFLGVMYCPSDA